MLIAVFIAMSLDGYIARPNGDIEWLNQYNTLPNEDYNFKAFYTSVDTIILGRKTYETCASFEEWPYKDKRVIVLSKTLESAYPSVEIFRGEPADLIAKLESDSVTKIWVDGGMTISSFLKAKLVDEVTLTLIPVLLGEGIPLFSDCKEHSLALSSTKSYASGLTQLQYKI